MSDATPAEVESQDAEQAALQRAAVAWAWPVFRELGARCSRCGERYPPEVRPPAVEEPDGPKAPRPTRAELADPPKPAEPPPPCPRCKVDPLSAQAGEKLTPHGSWLTELLRGASYLPRGAFHIIAGGPRIWKWAAVPTVINILVILLAVWGATHLSEVIDQQTSAEALASWTGWWWGTLSYGVRFLGWLGSLLSFILIPILATWLVVALPIVKIISMPFMELLGEGTEQAALGIVDESRFDLGRLYGNVVIAVIDALLLTLLQGLLYIILLPVNLIPFLGSLMWFLLPPAIFSGMDYSDLDLVRRGYTTREKIKLWSHHQWRFLGYGLSFCFLVTLPLVNMLAIPSAAAGGSLLYLELDRK